MQLLAGGVHVSKDDEFCIKNEELCIKNDELWIQMMNCAGLAACSMVGYVLAAAFTYR